MPVWLKLGLQVIGLTIVVLIVYNLLKVYVFSKIKVNKWIIFILSIIALFLPGILRANGIAVDNTILGYVIGGVSVLLFLWFLDLMGWTGLGGVKTKQKKDDIVIKPKAKPNRVKNNKGKENKN